MEGLRSKKQIILLGILGVGRLWFLWLQFIIFVKSIMLKGLKAGKKETKKETTEKKPVKNDAKKPKEEEEEETNVNLVDINYDEKQTATAAKPNKKAQTSKLDEKQIDASSIVIEKKVEKKAITSWVVEESAVKDLLRKDFNMKECDTQFESLTDAKINQQLEEKKKKQLEENKPKIQEKGGLKFAPLNTSNEGRVNPKEQELVLGKKIENVSNFTSLPIKELNFTNSNPTGNVNFVPLQKSAKEEELEKRTRKQPELIMKGAKGVGTGWLGAGKKEQTVIPQQPVEFKVSAWAAKANEVTNVSPNLFAPLQRSKQQQKFQKASNRKQQQFVFVSKKDQQQRRKARQVVQGVDKKRTTVDVNAKE